MANGDAPLVPGQNDNTDMSPDQGAMFWTCRRVAELDGGPA